MSTTLVTGTSTGIGYATAISIARSGRHVSATMRNLERSEELRAAAAAEDLPLEIYQLDVDSDDSVRDAVYRVSSEQGQIDGLVNNAGIGMHGSVEELPVSEFKQCMETNFFGVIRCIQAVVPGMNEASESKYPHTRRRQLAVAVPGGTRRRALPGVARLLFRRGVGRLRGAFR